MNPAPSIPEDIMRAMYRDVGLCVNPGMSPKDAQAAGRAFLFTFGAFLVSPLVSREGGPADPPAASRIIETFARAMRRDDGAVVVLAAPDGAGFTVLNGGSPAELATNMREIAAELVTGAAEVEAARHG